MKLKTSFFLLFFAFAQFVVAQSISNLIQVTDMLQIKQIGSTTLSPDGKMVAFTVNSVLPDDEIKDEYQYRSQIYLADTEGEPNPRQITTAIAGASQPAWSPDGKSISFVRAVKGRTQIFVLSLNGGEPLQITDFKYAVSSPKWSPDGKKILFSAAISLSELLKDSLLNPTFSKPIWPLEKPGFVNNAQLKNTQKANPNGNLDQIRAYLSKNEVDKKAKVFTKLNFQGEAATNPEFSFNHYFMVDVFIKAAPQPLTRGFYSFSNADFFNDGKSLIISSTIDSLQLLDRNDGSEIYTLSLLNGVLTKILSQPKTDFNNPVVSPSGKFLAYQVSPVDGINIPQLAILNLQNPSAQPIIIPFDRNKSQVTWSFDERYLYFASPSNGGTPVYKVNIKTQNIEQLSDYNAGISGLSIGKDKLVYVKTEVANPYELYVSDLSNKNIKALSTFNSSWLSTKTLSYPEKKIYTNSKGLKVEYWIIKPANFSPDKKYPIMLQIHGGPTAMWGPGEASMWHEFQFFAANGYGVVYSNPRGSGGYGQDFLRANYQDWGTGPTEDVIGALDGAMAQGWADTKKQVVTGGSYAGYLTAWIIAHDKRFAAASAQRGVYDLPTFFGEGNAWRLVPNYFGGYPWDDKIEPILKRESPFNYVDQITTPFLIFHGESDLRTGVIQSEMMYKALKVLNRPVEYVRHPGGTHELSRSGNVRQRLDQMLRIYEFFERYNVK